MPDKAVDLIDEAASRLRMEQESKPEEVDRLDRRIVMNRMEMESLRHEDDPASKLRYQSLNSKVDGMEQELKTLTSVWEQEKLELEKAKLSTQKLDAARRDLELVPKTLLQPLCFSYNRFSSLIASPLL